MKSAQVAGRTGAYALVFLLLLGTVSYGAPGVTENAAQPTRYGFWDYPWSVRIQFILRVVLAPKLLYSVHKMEVYDDGVWVEYSVTNLSSETKYVTPMFLDSPVRHLKAVDSDKRLWHVPQFEGMVQYKNPDTFIAIAPSMSIHFRSQVCSVRKPLELVNQAATPNPKRPDELAYWIGSWDEVYAELRRGPDERVTVYEIGDIPSTTRRKTAIANGGRPSANRRTLMNTG
jgi:hypothetical protein